LRRHFDLLGMTMRARLTAGVAASTIALAAACGSSSPRSGGAGSAYLDDASFRRSTLEASLVNPSNGYSQLRLAHYGGDWETLPEWNPPIEPVAARDLDARGGAQLDAAIGAGASPIAIDDAALAADPDALRALGETAFAKYPMQLASDEAAALHTRADAERYGAWVDDARGVGGLVRVQLSTGVALARTCATCHVGAPSGALVTGAPNAMFDLGRILVDTAEPNDPDLRARLLAWGPGRLDVTTRFAREPVRIPDLRSVRGLTHLQADGTVRQNDLATLALRVETLIITSHGATIRPPRVVALAIATYVWSLADVLPSRTPSTDEELRGQAYFAQTCAGCHAPPAFTGPPVDLAIVGTDPTIGLSSDRGTGKYRVPSLRGVSTRGPLLHDGSLPDLETMFDPARLDASFRGGRHGDGAILGHTFGLDADAAERASLIAYLRTL
jgi:hypothetical protein